MSTIVERHVHDEIKYALVSKMNQLGYVPKLIIDCFYHGSLPEHHHVTRGHEPILHIVPQNCDNIDSVIEQPPI